MPVSPVNTAIHSHSVRSSAPRVAPHYRLNQGVASVSEFIARTLIDQKLFQQQGISAAALLYLANNLIQLVSPQKPDYFELGTELRILYKELRGQTLSPEELIYNKHLHKLNVFGEIANGLKYSSMALLGKGAYDSLTSAISNGMSKYIPAILGYSVATLAGPEMIHEAVKSLLARSNFNKGQQDLLTPWLNGIGRLALGLSPRIHATTEGVHVHYPSTQGHHVRNASTKTMTQKGDILTVDEYGKLETPEGIFAATQRATFKLDRVLSLSDQRVRIQVVTMDGEPVPVDFISTPGPQGVTITIDCHHALVKAHWEQYFQPPVPKPALPSSMALSDVVFPVALVAMSSTLPGVTITSALLAFSSPVKVAARSSIDADVFRQNSREESIVKTVRTGLDYVFDVGVPTALALGSPPVGVAAALTGAFGLKQLSHSFLKIDPKTSILRRAIYDEVASIRTNFGRSSGSFDSRIKSKIAIAKRLVSSLQDDRITQSGDKLEYVATFLSEQTKSMTLFAENFADLSGKIVSHDAALARVAGQFEMVSTQFAQSSKKLNHLEKNIKSIDLKGQQNQESIRTLAAEVEVSFNEIEARVAATELNQEELTTMTSFLFDEATKVATAGFESSKKIMDLETELNEARKSKDILQVVEKTKAIKTELELESKRRIQFDTALNTIGDGFELVSIAAKLFGSPKLAYQISVVGNAAVTIGKSIGSLASIGVATAATSGPLAPTVAIAGAVFNIISLFMDSGPMIDEIILEQVQKVQKQVQQVREEMHSRFDRVEDMIVKHHEYTTERFNHLDELLVSLHKQMHTRFDWVEDMMNELYKDMLDSFAKLDISAVSIKMLAGDIKQQLDRIETKMGEGFRKLHEHQSFVTHARSALRYHSAHDVAMPLPERTNYFNWFYSAAIDDPFDTLNIGSPYTNAQDLINCLRQNDMTYCIRAMCGFLAAHVENIALPSDVPNPWVWAQRTNTLLEFIYRTPELELEQSRLDDVSKIVAVGEKFKHIVMEFRHSADAAQMLFSDYRTSVQQVRNEILKLVAMEDPDYIFDTSDSTVEGYRVHCRQTVQMYNPTGLARHAADIGQTLGRVESQKRVLDSSSSALSQCLRDSSSTAHTVANKVTVALRSATAAHDYVTGTDHGLTGKFYGRKIYVDKESCQAISNQRLTRAVSATWRWWTFNGDGNSEEVCPAKEIAIETVRKISDTQKKSEEIRTTSEVLLTKMKGALDADHTLIQDITPLGSSIEETRTAYNRVKRNIDKASSLFKEDPKLDHITEYMTHYKTSSTSADITRIQASVKERSSALYTALENLDHSELLLKTYLQFAFQSEIESNFEFRSEMMALDNRKKLIEFQHVSPTHWYGHLTNKVLVTDQLEWRVLEYIVDARTNEDSSCGHPIIEDTLRDLAIFQACFDPKLSSEKQPVKYESDGRICLDEGTLQMSSVR